MKSIRAVLVVLTLLSLSAIDARPTAAEVYRPWCVPVLGYEGRRDELRLHFVRAVPDDGDTRLRRALRAKSLVFVVWRGWPKT